jgi:hypothetical protein
LVPAVVGTSVVVALVTKDLRNLLSYREGKTQNQQAVQSSKVSSDIPKNNQSEQNHRKEN